MNANEVEQKKQTIQGLLNTCADSAYAAEHALEANDAKTALIEIRKTREAMASALDHVAALVAIDDPHGKNLAENLAPCLPTFEIAEAAAARGDCVAALAATRGRS